MPIVYHYYHYHHLSILKSGSEELQMAKLGDSDEADPVPFLQFFTRTNLQTFHFHASSQILKSALQFQFQQTVCVWSIIIIIIVIQSFAEFACRKCKSSFVAPDESSFHQRNDFCWICQSILRIRLEEGAVLFPFIWFWQWIDLERKRQMDGFDL